MKKDYTLLKKGCAFLFSTAFVLLFLAGCNDPEEEKFFEDTPATSARERKALIRIFEANPGNRLKWDTADIDLRNWDHLVITEDGNVSGLYLEFTGLTMLPPEIGALEHLTQLDIKDNDVTSLPAEIGKLSKLRSLIVSYNDVTSLPIEIGQLKELEFLAVDHNKLTSIPAEIGQLTSLRSLYGHYNELTAIPIEITQLDSMEALAIHHNNITTLPQAVCDWALATLTFTYNVDKDVVCE